jgi:hypothetical protein
MHHLTRDRDLLLHNLNPPRAVTDPLVAEYCPKGTMSAITQWQQRSTSGHQDYSSYSSAKELSRGLGCRPPPPGQPPVAAEPIVERWIPVGPWDMEASAETLRDKRGILFGSTVVIACAQENSDTGAVHVTQAVTMTNGAVEWENTWQRPVAGKAPWQPRHDPGGRVWSTGPDWSGWAS